MSKIVIDLDQIKDPSRLIKGTLPVSSDQNLVGRIVSGVKYVISGVTPSTWFGPSQPLTPIAQDTQGRLLDYPVGYNLQFQRRAYEAVSFEQMRALAENYDILRLVIETRKDQIARMEWGIRVRKEARGENKLRKPTPEEDKKIGTIRDRFAFPDHEHNWDQWLRMILEDMLVIDACSIYPRKTVGKDPYSFDAIDGATIIRRIDAGGRTPEPPSVAYQQVLKGVPANDLTRDQLVYMPRNPRTWKIFGYSPVEQIIRTVNIGLRRMIFQLAYYTEGNVPEALIGVPETWTVDQIRDFQTYWDSLMEGNLAARRHAKFVPAGTTYNETKGSAFDSDGFAEEWLARIVCYAFSVSWSPFVKMVNRATSENAMKMAQQEGLAPLLQWVKNLMDLLIWKYYQEPSLEFYWETEEAVKPVEQAQIDKTYIDCKVKKVNEVRETLGLEPYSDEELEEMKNPLGLLPGQNPFAKPEDDEEDGGNGKKPFGEKEPPDDKKKTEPGKTEPAEKIQKGKKKIRRLIRRIDRQREAVLTARKALKKIMLNAFDAGIDAVHNWDLSGYIKYDVVIHQRAKEYLAKLDLDGWAMIIGEAEPVIEALTKSGVYEALYQIGLSDQDITQAMSKLAVDYAKKRGAELVGMRLLADGTIIENPNPKWAISENTRKLLRADVERAITEGMSTDQLKDLVMENYAFSEERAEMIARTETAFADVRGNMIAYKESGVVEKKQWILATNHPEDDDCDLNAEQGAIPLEEPFQDGSMEPPQHPNCLCDVVPIIEEMED